METRILMGQRNNDLQEAANLLRAGEAVAFPTDTVYGLGAHALDETAVQKIYEAKGRPSDKPLIILIWDKSQLEKLTVHISETARKLMDVFWPGPLTLVFRQRPNAVPPYVTRGLDTVAVRMPNHPVALKLLQLADIPIAAPSANLSGNPSPVDAAQVQQELSGRIAAIVDGGTCDVGVASTILDVSGAVPVILRQGTVSQEQLEQMIGIPIQGTVKKQYVRVGEA